MFRPNLPVPRGVISLKELFYIAITLIIIQITLQIIFFPKMLFLYVFVMLYMFLMLKEFFMADWLKRNQFFYVITHIAIVPVVDIWRATRPPGRWRVRFMRRWKLRAAKRWVRAQIGRASCRERV